MTAPDANPWQAPQTPPTGPASPPPPPQGYHPPAQYGGPQTGGWPSPGAPAYGPPGKVRPTGTSILLFVVTLSIYSYVYNYKVHSEMKAHSGRGVGGGVALLLTIVAGIAMPFITPSEVGGLYSRRGLREPVRAWTGLWLLLPLVGGYVVMLIAMVAIASTADPGASAGDGEAIALGVGFVLFFAVAVAGAATWFVKTNGALNRYWQSVGAQQHG